MQDIKDLKEKYLESIDSKFYYQYSGLAMLNDFCKFVENFDDNRCACGNPKMDESDFCSECI